ncbi:MAG: hypothetical protein IPL46_29940 [Saprospiraceae bacterium]|nr:hypothetical protein [Saprospiraceae bacterium]
MNEEYEKTPVQKQTRKWYKGLLVVIASAMTLFSGLFYGGTIYQETKDNIEIATSKLKILQIEFENNELNKKFAELKDENENIKKENTILKDKLTSVVIKIPSNSCTNPKNDITVFIKNSLTKLPIKKASVFNGGGRNFQTGFTDDEGKLTINFSLDKAQITTLIFVSAETYIAYDTKLNLCQAERTITIFLQPK